ncbi:MAG: hypothetical protein K5842_05905 [Bacteroidales bacterium]|nr:hypothetical protein [Bacteroidales bacterium]
MTTRLKKLLTIAAPTLLLLASCDTKTCKCYIYNGNNNPYIEQEYVSEGTSCSSLDYDHGTQYRTCLEYNEPDIDPNDIGQEYKK